MGRWILTLSSCIPHLTAFLLSSKVASVPRHVKTMATAAMMVLMQERQQNRTEDVDVCDGDGEKIHFRVGGRKLS